MTDTSDMIPATEERVQENTAEEINRRIRRELEARVYYFAQRTDLIGDRLRELDDEWDIERILETNAGILSLAGVAFGAMRGRWHLLSAVVAAFLVQHAVEGWCPPIPVFRRLGIRTTAEINHERFALKALRGDFDNVRAEGAAPEEQARRALEAADSFV